MIEKSALNAPNEGFQCFGSGASKVGQYVALIVQEEKVWTPLVLPNLLCSNKREEPSIYIESTLGKNGSIEENISVGTNAESGDEIASDEFLGTFTNTNGGSDSNQATLDQTPTSRSADETVELPNFVNTVHGASESADDDFGYELVSATGPLTEKAEHQRLDHSELARQLAFGFERLQNDVAKSISSAIGRVLEPIVIDATRIRMTDLFLEAVADALAVRSGGPYRIDAPLRLAGQLRKEMEKLGLPVEVCIGPDIGLTLHLDNEVLATRFPHLIEIVEAIKDD